MIYDLYEVAGRLRSDAAGAIAQWEQHYSMQIAQVAELVMKNRSRSPVVLLSGPSGASKTTSGGRLRDLLITRKVPAHLVSMDNYYLPWEDPGFPVTADGQRDLEAPGCLDIQLLNEHFAMLERGEPIDVPIYSFPTHSRLNGRSMHLDISPGDVFIFEGIHALNELFTQQHPKACRVYVSPVSSFGAGDMILCTPQQLRLMRRIVRDHQFRGATAEYSLQLWDNVIASEKIYIEPHLAQADGVVDATLGYELQALQPYIVPLLRELPEDIPCYREVQEALRGLSYITPLDSKLIPPDSILREFIGAMPL